MKPHSVCSSHFVFSVEQSVFVPVLSVSNKVHMTTEQQRVKTLFRYSLYLQFIMLLTVKKNWIFCRNTHVLAYKLAVIKSLN